MILVDTSVWIDHLRVADHRLAGLLTADEIGCHPLVIEELAVGSLGKRDVVVELLSSLLRFPTVAHQEVLHFVERRRLWGRGLSAIDVHLLGSIALVSGAQLWTRDGRLRTAAEDIGVAVFPDA